MSIRNDVDIRKLKIQVEDLENAVAELTKTISKQDKTKTTEKKSFASKFK